MHNETDHPGTYSQTSHGITVFVTPHFLEDHSEPDENRFVWAYHVRIVNGGNEQVQLFNRYWRITDATGHAQEVRGEGVVGEKPVLDPGESFEYTSGTPLSTGSGFMVGSYQMKTSSGHWVDVDVPAFSLDSPHDRAKVH